MTRRHFTFACEGDRLVATLDAASGTTGLLLVTGGNEVRSGAWAGQALFAQAVAAAGHPVLRFDRRGCGDSEGDNAGFRGSADDIGAALAALRAECPQLARVVAMGNCDAASALMLARGAGADGLILSNPWTFESDDTAEVPPEAVRNHYRNRLADWGAIRRLLTGKIALGPLVRSLLSAARPAGPPSSLAQQIAAGIGAFRGPVRILIAGRDRTGLTFLAGWDKTDPRIRQADAATHSYVEPQAREWLVKQTCAFLEDVGRASRNSLPAGL
jgi:exosortase A-associated hydrolase 1